MNSLKSMRMDIYADGDREMCTIEARMPEGSPGLRYISFYMTRKEFTEIVMGRSNSATDIGHNLRAYGDVWTFYDLDFPSKAEGVMQVPYVNLQIPKQAQLILLKAAQRVWAGLKKNPPVNRYSAPRISIELSLAWRNRMIRLYGVGKGEVQLDLRSITPLQLDKECQTESFKFAFERVQAIARNSTGAYFQSATLYLSKDREDDYYWTAINPKGMRIMHGSISNHGTSEKPDWSIHT